jgi:hypothetical protein
MLHVFAFLALACHRLVRVSGSAAALAFLPLVFAATATAQSVRWEADPSAPNSVQLVFRDCEPDGNPTLPTLTGATLTFLGQSSNMSIVNFEMSRTVTFSYLVRARQSTPVQIPSFQVKTSKGAMTVPAFTVAQPGASLDSVASSKLMPDRTTVWAGEVFGLAYELSASRRNEPQISPDFEWNASPLIAEDWTKPEVVEAVVGGDRRLQVVYRTRAVAKTPNTYKLEAANHLLSIRTGTIGFGIISQPRMEAISVTSDQPTIQVRALPPPPAGFTGAVGTFKLVSKVVPEKAVVGEPVTWTLELSGTGNWPDLHGLPSREVSNDFQVVQPKAKRSPVEGKLFDATLVEDVVLVPSKTGTYTLGPVDLHYFDPKSGSYKTITAPKTTVTITGTTTPMFNVTTQPSTEPAPAPPAEPKPAVAPTAPAAPIGIPRDPLAGSDSVLAPLSKRELVSWMIAPFAGLLLLWAGLAIRRAHQTDPARARREARLRVRSTLAQLGKAAPAEYPALLLSRQRYSALMWGISHAAPPAQAVPDASWSQLWSEADRALYGQNSALPSDWHSRAAAALAAQKVPSFKPWRAFLPQNLMPFAAGVAILLAATPLLLRAAELDAAAAYRKGDFAGAEKSWRAAVTQRPTDWISRHNLSLALAQRDQTGESAVHAAAAFVQQPSNASVQWHFALASEKAGFAPSAIIGFITPGPRQSLAQLAAPSRWQVWMIVGSFACAIAVGALLLNAYGRRRRAINWTAGVVIFLGVVLSGTAAAGVATYGMAADARAVVTIRAGTLRSIPTEADTTQKTIPVAAGSMAIIDRTFLGWNHLAFDNGQTGWVRKEEVVGLWR